MRIKYGTNRLVLVCKDHAYKIALHYRGLVANWMEYIKSIDNPLIATTEIKWYGLKQERLYDCEIYPYETQSVKDEHKHLFDIMLHNRLQVGKSKDGLWKIYDYEDIKFYEKEDKK